MVGIDISKIKTIFSQSNNQKIYREDAKPGSLFGFEFKTPKQGFSVSMPRALGGFAVFFFDLSPEPTQVRSPWEKGFTTKSPRCLMVQ